MKRQFSLRWMGLLLIVAALSFAAWGEHLRVLELRSRLAEMTAEVEGYRREMGYLEIHDPACIHAVGLRSSGSRRWKWRVYLPEGRKFRLYQVAGAIPPSAPDVLAPDIGVGISTTLNHAGQFVIEASLTAADANARSRYHFEVSLPHGTDRVSVVESTRPWVTEGWYSSSGVDAGEVVQLSAGQPLCLLALKAQDIERDAESPEMIVGAVASSGPCDGVMLWIGEADDAL